MNKNTDKPDEKKDYLVAYLKSDGKFSKPNMAYWVESEQKFFSSFCCSIESFPVIADIWIEIPDLP